MAETEKALGPRLRYLRHYQAERLKETYHDLLKDPRYADACRFFLNQIYTAEDTRERDEHFKGLYGRARPFMTDEMIHTADKVLELHKFSHELDEQLAETLREMGAPVEFDEEAYERAYREADNYDERMEQIRMLAEVVRRVHALTRRRTFRIGMAMLERAPFLPSGEGIVPFMREGYHAMDRLKDPEEFIRRITGYEIDRLNRIYEREGHAGAKGAAEGREGGAGEGGKREED